MADKQGPSVTIEQDGRSESVLYEEDGWSITGWWEFAEGDAIAIPNMGNAAEWERIHVWASAWRATFLRFIAEGMIRQ